MKTSLATPVGELSLDLAEISGRDGPAGEPLDVAGDSSPEEDLGLVEKNDGEADLRGESPASLKSEQEPELSIERKGLGTPLPGPLRGNGAGDGLLSLLVVPPGPLRDNEAGDELLALSLLDGVEGRGLG